MKLIRGFLEEVTAFEGRINMKKFFLTIGIVFLLTGCNSGSGAVSNTKAINIVAVHGAIPCATGGCNFNNNGVSIYSTSANIAGNNGSIAAYCSGQGYLESRAYSYSLPSYIAPAITVNSPGICNGVACAPNVILDRFNETYDDLDNDLANIANEGYSTFWILPVQKSNNLTYGPSNVFAWYSQYQAIDYGNFNSYYGSQSELSTLIADTHSNNLKILLDVSFHQMAAPTNVDHNGNFSFPQSANGPIAAVTLNGNTSTGGADFANPQSKCWFGPLPGPQNGNPTCGSSTPSTNVLNLFTQFTELTLNSSYLNADGFRIDELNIDSGGIGTTLLTDILNNSSVNTTNKTFFGEYPSGAYNRVLGIKVGNGNASNGNYMEMLNFPFLYDMVTAFNPGGSLNTLSQQFNSSSAGGVNGTSAINMVVDQDTVPDAFNTRAMCGSGNTMNYYNASLGYALILAINAGTPFIYADASAGVNTSAWNSGDKSVDYENVTEVKAGVYFHNITQYQPMTIVYATDNILGLTRGTQYFFIENKSATSKTFTYNNSFNLQNFANGKYVDLISGELITVTSNKISSTFYLPPQSAMFFVPYKP